MLADFDTRSAPYVVLDGREQRQSPIRYTESIRVRRISC